MEFRKSLAADFEAYAALRRESILALSAPYYTQAQREDWVNNIDSFKIGAMMAQGDFIIGVEPSERMTCAGAWQGDEVSNLYVSPDFAGRGWGRALLAQIETQYRVRTGNAHIFADASNNARSFYAANGYEFMGLEEIDKPGRVPYSYSRMKKNFV